MRKQQQTAFPWVEQEQPPGATTAILPVVTERTMYDAQALVAPPPVIDRQPIVVGQNLSLAYLSACYRLCTQGWRYQFVDALNELLEHDPHARGVLRQRIIPLTGAPIEVLPAKLPKTVAASEVELAKTIADEVQRQIDALPSRAQAISRLAWGIVYGLSGSETEWNRDSSGPVRWQAKALHFIHSRRLNFSNPVTWDPYIYDQGPAPWGGANSSGTYGLRVADLPGKFIVHAPALNGDYSTRDGEGRYVGFYLALKRTIVRATAQDFERTIRPWVVGYFNREADKDRKTVASKQDIAALQAACTALGLGSLNSSVLPDACRIEILRAASTMSVREFLDFLDDQVTKSALGQTYTTSPKSHGTHQAAGVADAGSLKITRFDAQCLADTLERDLVYWIVELNWPGMAARFAPKLRFGIDDEPEPMVFANLVKVATSCDIPIDVDEAGERMGLPVIAKEDMETARRTRVVAATKDHPVEPSGDDPNDPSSTPNEPPEKEDKPANGEDNS